MNHSLLTIIVTYHTLPGQAEPFFKAVTASGIAAGVRQEPGNLGYAFYLPLEEPDTLVLIEKWENQACADAHPMTDNVKQLAKIKPAYVSDTSCIRYCEYTNQ